MERCGMGRIQKRSAGLFVILAVMIISCVCCTGKESEKKENIEDKWLQSANLEAQESPEELTELVCQFGRLDDAKNG